jgi:branched-chain amino acid transport system permease protein
MFNQLLLNAIIAGSIYTMIAVGFSLIYSTTKFFHFAHAAVYTSCSYFVYLYTIYYDLPLNAGIALAILSSTLLGMCTELVIYKPLRRKGSSPLVMLLASLGFYIIFQNIVSLVFGDDTKTFASGIITEGMEIFGARITPIQIAIIAVSVFLLLICWALTKYTKMGIAMRAVASDPELAIVSGIDTDKTILFAFTSGSMLAGTAAILTSFDIGMTPTMGMNVLMMGVVAVIVGGVGSIPGAALGGFLLAFAQNFGVWKISSQWQDAIAFIILLLFLLYRPNGFFGKKIRKVEV